MFNHHNFFLLPEIFSLLAEKMTKAKSGVVILKSVGSDMESWNVTNLDQDLLQWMNVLTFLNKFYINCQYLQGGGLPKISQPDSLPASQAPDRENFSTPLCVCIIYIFHKGIYLCLENVYIHLQQAMYILWSISTVSEVLIWIFLMLAISCFISHYFPIMTSYKLCQLQLVYLLSLAWNFSKSF